MDDPYHEADEAIRDAFSQLLSKLLRCDDALLLIKIGYAKSTITSYRSRFNSKDPKLKTTTMIRMLKRAGVTYTPSESPGKWTFPDELLN